MRDDEVKALRLAVRNVAHELSIWSADVLAEGGFYGSHEDLAARLSAIAQTLMDALRPPPSTLHRAPA